MNKITIADVAKKANVSLSTASYALNNKSGVGEKTRARILQIAKELNYQPNAIASSLKRSSFNILVSLPSLTEGFEYFFSYIYEGIKAYINQLTEYKINIIYSEYNPNIKANQAEAIKKAISENNIDGIITNGQSDTEAKKLLDLLYKNEMPIVYVGGNKEEKNKLAFVAPHYFITGTTIAQLITTNLKPEDAILILCGNKADISHYEVVQGFDEYIKEYKIQNKVIKLYSDNGEDDKLEEIINAHNIKACCSVGARITHKLGQVLKKMDREVFAVGSDLFTESRTFLEEGIFDAIVQKNPYKASYFGAQILCNKIIKNQKPTQDEYYTATEIIIKSNLPLYIKGKDRVIF